MTAVAAGPTGYVAVGQEDYSEEPPLSLIWTSSDGKVWKRARLPAGTRADANNFTGAFADRGGFIAWAQDDRGNGGGAVVWTCPDGTTWSRVPDIPSFAEAEIAGIARRDDALVAVGTTGQGFFSAWTSTDGRTWRVVPGTRTLGDVESVDGFAVTADWIVVTATSYNGDVARTVILRSPDGIHWQKTVWPIGRGELSDIAASDQRFVTVGTHAWTSSDGRTWLKSVFRPATDPDLELVISRGTEFLALGGGESWRSADGRVWTRLASVPDAARDGEYGIAPDMAPGPMEWFPRTQVQDLTNGPHGPVAVGSTQLDSGGLRAVVWVLR
jgi:hypothetical protein